MSTLGLTSFRLLLLHELFASFMFTWKEKCRTLWYVLQRRKGKEISGFTYLVVKIVERWRGICCIYCMLRVFVQI